MSNTCLECGSVLQNSTEKINDELLAMENESGPAKQPSASTLKIVIFANALMNRISTQSYGVNDFEAVWKTIYNYLDIDDLYTNANFVHAEKTSYVDHKEKFVIEVVKQYMTLKSKNIGRKITEEEKGERIRQRRTDAIHKAGQ